MSSAECAICGHVWRPEKKRNKNSVLVILAALCALLAAGIFAFVVIVRSRANEILKQPLVAEISSIVTDENNNFKVTGNILNRGTEIYGVPDIVIVSYDGKDNVLSRQKFLPGAPLLDPGATLGFEYTVTPSSVGSDRLGVELASE